MGRVKLEIKKIENIQSRHITYAKRRNGLIKKAYELSVLCDIDMALIMFSPSSKLSHFACKKTKIEDVIARFASLPEHERAKCQAPKRQDNHDIPLSTRIENHELLLKAVKKLNLESDIASHPGSISSANIENTRMEIRKIEMQSQATEERLRIYEMDPKCLDSVYKAQRLEQLVEHTLKRVQMRKQALLENNPLVAFSSAQMQLYAMQAQAGILGGYQATQQFIPWLLLKEPQTTIQNLIDHANSGAILTARDTHGTLDYSSNASLYPGLMAQGADLQLTTQSNQPHVRTLTTQSNQPHVRALTHLKSEGYYPFERSMMHGKDIDLPGCASPKVEEDQVRQEMVGAYAPKDVLSSASVLQSAYQNAAISIASPSSNQFPLGQQAMLSNVQNSMMSQSDTMQHFEGNMPTSHVESSHNEQAHSHSLLSLGCTFNN